MPSSHALRFSHPVVGELELATGLDSATWGYSLNTAPFSTYGGEVIQILSCQVDDLNLAGTFRTYREMESFYTYMMKYMQVASQGRLGPKKPGQTSYNQEAMTFLYPERGWDFLIMPTSAPGFRKGTEVVAPSWTMQAHIIDHAGDVEDLKDLIVQESEIQERLGVTGEFTDSFGLQGKIGYDPDNPFSDPFVGVGPTFDLKSAMADEAEAVGEAYVKIIENYLDKNFETFLPDLSGPVKQAAKKVKKTQSKTEKNSPDGATIQDSNTDKSVATKDIKVIKATKRKAR